MTIKSYADVLKWAIQIQLDEVEQNIEHGEFATEYFEGYNNGVARGLEIALEKIQASMFLAKE